MDRNRYAGDCTAAQAVALRKESVDRNGLEINGVSYDVVALRKESVDRNKMPVPACIYSNSRSPQGERG